MHARPLGPDLYDRARPPHFRASSPGRTRGTNLVGTHSKACASTAGVGTSHVLSAVSSEPPLGTEGHMSSARQLMFSRATLRLGIRPYVLRLLGSEVAHMCASLPNPTCFRIASDAAREHQEDSSSSSIRACSALTLRPTVAHLRISCTRIQMYGQ